MIFDAIILALVVKEFLEIEERRWHQAVLTGVITLAFIFIYCPPKG